MRMNLRTMCGQIIDDTLWFSSSNCNALMNYCFSSGEIRIVDEFDNYDTKKENIHRQCFLYESWLIFIPQMSSSIDCFNYITREQRHILIAPEGEKLIASGEIVLNKLYLFPMNINQKAIVIDLNKLEIVSDQFTTEIELVKQRAGRDKIVFTRSSKKNNIVFSGIYNTNKYLVYDVNTHKSVLMESNIDDIFFATRTTNGVWVVGISGQIEYIDDNGKSSIYNTQIPQLSSGECAYNRLIEYDKYVVILPAKGCDVLFLKNGEINKSNYSSLVETKVEDDWIKFFDAIVYKGKLYTFPFAYPYMFMFKNEECSAIPMKYYIKEDLKEKERKILRNLYESSLKEIIFESDELINLKDYLLLL